MKTKLMAAVSVLALSAITNANAADIIRHHEIPTVIVKPINNFTWTGFYIGAQAGYKWGRQKARIYGSSKADYNFGDDVKGGAAGAFAGFNTNLENGSLFGIETDMLWNKLKGHHGYRSDSDNNDKYNYNLGLSEKWSGATRLRIGYGRDRILPYLAAGVAYSRLSTDDSSYRENSDDGVRVSSDSKDQTYVGWTVGAGIDYAATDNILVRLEYRYSDYGKKDFTLSNDRNATIKYNTHDVRVGVAYKF